ncbi:hypothetical protein IHE56_15065 [Streptomyces sp. ID01-12c]|uniref:hypothetical protein n=1 Tax=Streptomyces caniscabiei TaxID=2746961 RepID=UPI0017876D40|nr:hypothetical protein [Streptomyces caniscabiei]MBD9703377.1 hypothetical protein [Streptomyces caniscabiei]MDX3726867.1 hypothetical protein [Streptomyces caniscabiei]
MDQLIEEVAAVSGPLQKYRVTRGGVETVMKLNEADAKRLGVGAGDVVGAASTIPVVEPVEEPEGGDGDGSADDTGDVQAVAIVGAGAEPVQPVADSGSDGQAPGDPEATADPGSQEEAAVTETGDGTAATAPADPGDTPAVKAPARAPAKKTAAKKQTASANKARTAAANKAESPGG